MGALPTQDNIQMSGPGVILREASGAGLSSRASFASLRSLLTAITAAEAQALIDASIAALIDGAPGALNTLDELAAALGDDANAIATLTSAIAAKYTKPGTGIPSTDLSSAVQSLLTLAGTSLQSIKTVNGNSLVGSGNVTIGSAKGFRAVANHYYHAHGINSFGTGVSMSANTLYFVPFRFRTTETWTKIHAFVNAAAFAGNLRLGIWCPDDSGDGLSTSAFTLISDCGVVSMATTGLKEITGLSVTIDANKIYLLSLLSDQAWTALGASLSTAGAQGVEWLTFGQNSAFNFYLANQFTKSQAYGALPSTITGATLTALNIPAIGLRL